MSSIFKHHFGRQHSSHNYLCDTIESAAQAVDMVEYLSGRRHTTPAPFIGTEIVESLGDKPTKIGKGEVTFGNGTFLFGGNITIDKDYSTLVVDATTVKVAKDVTVQNLLIRCQVLDLASVLKVTDGAAIITGEKTGNAKPQVRDSAQILIGGEMKVAQFQVPTWKKLNRVFFELHDMHEEDITPPSRPAFWENIGPQETVGQVLSRLWDDGDSIEEYVKSHQDTFHQLFIGFLKGIADRNIHLAASMDNTVEETTIDLTCLSALSNGQLEKIGSMLGITMPADKGREHKQSLINDYVGTDPIRASRVAGMAEIMNAIAQPTTRADATENATTADTVPLTPTAAPTNN